jgi:hypothetical protein
MPTVYRTMARSLLVLILACVLNCSTSPKRHSQQKLTELPVPVTVAPETAVAVPEISAPMEVKPKTSAVVPKTPSELESPLLTPEPRFYIHRVRWSGETLSIIAQWYTGSLKNWKALSNANPTLDLNRIVIGANIFIPEDLLKSHKPMPFSFLSSSVPKKRVQAFPSKKPSTASGAAELFGPIETDQSSIESGRVELFGPIENGQASIDPEAELFKPLE